MIFRENGGRSLTPVWVETRVWKFLVRALMVLQIPGFGVSMRVESALNVQKAVYIPGFLQEGCMS